MAYPNIEAILEEGGDITVGRVGPIDCVASASTSNAGRSAPQPKTF